MSIIRLGEHRRFPPAASVRPCGRSVRPPAGVGVSGQLFSTEAYPCPPAWLSYHVFIFNAIKKHKKFIFSLFPSQSYKMYTLSTFPQGMCMPFFKNAFFYALGIVFLFQALRSPAGKSPLKTGKEGAMITKHRIRGKPGEIPQKKGRGRWKKQT